MINLLKHYYRVSFDFLVCRSEQVHDHDEVFPVINEQLVRFVENQVAAAAEVGERLLQVQHPKERRRSRDQDVAA